MSTTTCRDVVFAGAGEKTLVASGLTSAAAVMQKSTERRRAVFL